MPLNTIFPCLTEKAQIDGGHLSNETSVFLHIERGLRQNPHGLAVISIHQPAGHLASLVQRDDHASQYDCLAWTYSQVHRTALRLAAGMLAHGMQPNSVILMMIPNGGEYALLLWTSIILRLTIVCLDPSLLNDSSRHAELQGMLHLVTPGIVVLQNATNAGIFAHLQQQQQQQQQQPFFIILDDTPTPASYTPLSTLAIPSEGIEGIEGIEKSLLSLSTPDPPTRTHSILFTSGTSGHPPKACPLRVSGMTHILHSQSWLITAENCARALQQAHNSRGIAPAQTLQTWREGGAVVMTGNGFSAGDLVDAIVGYRVTFIVMTPAMVFAVGAELERRRVATDTDDTRAVDCVRSIQIGGDAVTKDVLEKCCGMFPRAQVCVNHGMTEGGGAFFWPFAGVRVEDVPFYGEICPVGAVAPGAVVRVWDVQRGRVVRRGRLGELHVCCGSTIPGYLGGVSADSFYDDYDDGEKRRWFNTGDVAMMDRKGMVFILGRRKDMIRRGGEVIMPAAVESCIEKYTSRQTCVVAIPHPRLGHEPFAVLENLNGKTEAQIKRHVVRTFGRRYALGGVASLEQLRLDGFPVNATHKIIKTEVEAAVKGFNSVQL